MTAGSDVGVRRSVSSIPTVNSFSARSGRSWHWEADRRANRAASTGRRRRGRDDGGAGRDGDAVGAARRRRARARFVHHDRRRPTPDDHTQACDSQLRRAWPCRDARVRRPRPPARTADAAAALRRRPSQAHQRRRRDVRAHRGRLPASTSAGWRTHVTGEDVAQPLQRPPDALLRGCCEMPSASDTRVGCLEIAQRDGAAAAARSRARAASSVLASASWALVLISGCVCN